MVNYLRLVTEFPLPARIANALIRFPLTVPVHAARIGHTLVTPKNIPIKSWIIWDSNLVCTCILYFVFCILCFFLYFVFFILYFVFFYFVFCLYLSPAHPTIQRQIPGSIQSPSTHSSHSAFRKFILQHSSITYI